MRRRLAPAAMRALQSDGAAPRTPGVRWRGPLRPAPLPPGRAGARLAESAPFHGADSKHQDTSILGKGREIRQDEGRESALPHKDMAAAIETVRVLESAQPAVSPAFEFLVCYRAGSPRSAGTGGPAMVSIPRSRSSVLFTSPPPSLEPGRVNPARYRDVAAEEQPVDDDNASAGRMRYKSTPSSQLFTQYSQTYWYGTCAGTVNLASETAHRADMPRATRSWGANPDERAQSRRQGRQPAAAGRSVSGAP